MTKRDKYEKFFSFIETELNKGKDLRPSKENYKKTLFCSPHFKD